jgi:hypothetical protein
MVTRFCTLKELEGATGMSKRSRTKPHSQAICRAEIQRRKSALIISTTPASIPAQAPALSAIPNPQTDQSHKTSISDMPPIMTCCPVH